MEESCQQPSTEQVMAKRSSAPVFRNILISTQHWSGEDHTVWSVPADDINKPLQLSDSYYTELEINPLSNLSHKTMNHKLVKVSCSKLEILD